MLLVALLKTNQKRCRARETRHCCVGALRTPYDLSANGLGRLDATEDLFTHVNLTGRRAARGTSNKGSSAGMRSCRMLASFHGDRKDENIQVEKKTP